MCLEPPLCSQSTQPYTQSFRNIVVSLDHEWGHEIQASTPCKQALAVVAFTTTWYMDEECFLYFFACRTQVAWPIFAGPFALATAASNSPLPCIIRRMTATCISSTFSGSITTWT